MMNRKFRWIPPVIWGLLVAVLSLIPGGAGNFNLFGITHIDKVGHFGMYAIWALLIFFAFAGFQQISLQRAMWMSFLLGTLIGILLEFGQFMLTVDRSFEINDMIANGLGSFIGPLAGYLFQKWRSPKT